MTATTTDQINSLAYLTKTEEILICGVYQTTKGVIAGTDKDGNLNWFYALHEPCAYIYTDDKESTVNAILWSSGNTLEIHSYNSENTLDRYYMYELNTTDIIAVNAASINNDFNWVLVTLSDNSCYMIMITKIRRKVYQCSGQVSFKGLRFINSDPITIGNDPSGNIYSARFLSDRFEFEWQRSLTGMISTEMAINNNYDSTDTSSVFCAMSLDSSNYLLVINFNYENGHILDNKYLEYSMSNIRINYNDDQQDFLISGYISGTYQNVFVRYNDGVFSNLRVTKANNNANYLISPLSITLDEKNNILMGGMYDSKRLLLYKTGEELSAYSCVLTDSTRINTHTLVTGELEITEAVSSLTLSQFTSADWKNQTGRIFSYTTGLTMKNQ